MPNAILARRLVGSAAFNPANLGGGSLVGWYKADAITGVADAGIVSTWRDSSSNGRNLTQGTGGKEPIYKVGIQNNLPVVRFDGTNDFLASASFTLNQPTEIYAVLIYRSAAINVVSIAGTGAAFLNYRTASTTISLFAGSTAPSATTTPEAWHLYRALLNGASSDIDVDGATTTGNAGATNPGGITLGSNQAGAASAQVDIGEVVVYAASLALADRATLRTYLRSKWATP